MVGETMLLLLYTLYRIVSYDSGCQRVSPTLAFYLDSIYGTQILSVVRKIAIYYLFFGSVVENPDVSDTEKTHEWIETNLYDHRRSTEDNLYTLLYRSALAIFTLSSIRYFRESLSMILNIITLFAKQIIGWIVSICITNYCIYWFFYILFDLQLTYRYLLFSPVLVDCGFSYMMVFYLTESVSTLYRTKIFSSIRTFKRYLTYLMYGICLSFSYYKMREDRVDILSLGIVSDVEHQGCLFLVIILTPLILKISFPESLRKTG